MTLPEFGESCTQACQDGFRVPDENGERTKGCTCGRRGPITVGREPYKKERPKPLAIPYTNGVVAPEDFHNGLRPA